MQLHGRTFEVVTTTTIQQDAFVIKRMRSMGMEEMVRSFDPATGNLDAFSERILLQAFEDGVLFEVLGGILLEPGVVWTPARALENAAFFATLTDETDKETLYGAIGQLVVDFLLSAAQWSKTFRRSSVLATGEPPRGVANPSAPSEVPSHTTTASGTDWPEPVAAVIPVASERS